MKRCMTAGREMRWDSLDFLVVCGSCVGGGAFESPDRGESSAAGVGFCHIWVGEARTTGAAHESMAGGPRSQELCFCQGI
jgi:hypothetical protein